MYPIPFSAEIDVNDLINILNNSSGEADISQSFLVNDESNETCQFSGQTYKCLCGLKGQVN